VTPLDELRTTLNFRSSLFYASVLALCSAGCAGQIATQTGIQGPAIAAKAPVSVVVSPVGADAASNLAQAAVTHALVQQGHTVSADARLHVEVAIAERSAPIAVDNATGEAVSPSRKRRFLQSCAYRIQRLTIAVYSDDKPGVTKVWAEEKHCKGGIQDSIKALSESAVALLIDPTLARETRRTGKN
jgi:hypothetical protein